MATVFMSTLADGCYFQQPRTMFSENKISFSAQKKRTFTCFFTITRETQERLWERLETLKRGYKKDPLFLQLPQRAAVTSIDHAPFSWLSGIRFLAMTMNTHLPASLNSNLNANSSASPFQWYITHTFPVTVDSTPIACNAESILCCVKSQVGW